MGTESLVAETGLSADECRKRIAEAESNSVSDIVGYALSSQVTIVDGGDRFEVRSNLDPVVLTASISPTASGCTLRGQIEVPAQRFYRVLSGFVVLVAVWLVVASGYDLVFGTHILRTRARTELGLGQPASIEQHFAVFFLVPALAVGVLALLWPKTRPMRRDAIQTLREFVEKLFEVSSPRSRQEL
jgi:hypothetical protein